jgi:hypothetical protein
MKENDKQLERFFAQNKQEISDNGFSDRVTQHLPEKQRTPGLVWIFAVVSTLLVVLTGNYTRIYYVVMAILEQTSWWILPVISCSVAAVIIWIVSSHERKETIFQVPSI